MGFPQSLAIAVVVAISSIVSGVLVFGAPSFLHVDTAETRLPARTEGDIGLWKLIDPHRDRTLEIFPNGSYLRKENGLLQVYDTRGDIFSLGDSPSQFGFGVPISSTVTGSWFVVTDASELIMRIPYKPALGLPARSDTHGNLIGIYPETLAPLKSPSYCSLNAPAEPQGICPNNAAHLTIVALSQGGLPNFYFSVSLSSDGKTMTLTPIGTGFDSGPDTYQRVVQ